MCAPDEPKMDIATYDSTSTARTLVGSDAGRDDFLSPDIRKPAIPVGIVQTPDNKQWIDLDLISPQLLRELRRQHDTSTEEPKTPFARRAAKIKAWTRQTKLGFDVRLRRRIDQEHDEVTDFQLVRDPLATFMDEKPMLLPEMPANSVFELGDTSIAAELPGTLDQREHNAEPTEVSGEESLPRYESSPANAATQRPRLRVDTRDMGGDDISHSRSPSGSSIVATPTRGLSVERQSNDEKSPTHDVTGAANPVEVHISSVESFETHHDDNIGQAKSNTTEELHALLKALREQLASQSTVANIDKSQLEDLKIAQRLRYETETDAEPPSPSDTKAHRKSLRTFSVGRKKSPRTKLTSPKVTKKKNESTDPDSSLAPNHLPRRQTLPKKVLPSAGAENAWTALLKSQAKILGPEHPLCFSARHSQALSRVRQHQECPPDVLDALRESETFAIQNLGKVHPLVEAFSADLDTLELLIVDRRARSMTRPTSAEGGSSWNSSKDDSQHSSFDEDPDLSRLFTEQVHAGNASHLVDPGQGARPKSDGPHLPIPSIQTSFHGGNELERSDSFASSSALWNTTRPPHQPSSGVALLAGQLLTGLTYGLKQGLTWIEHTCGPEPRVEPGKVRVRWTCACGKQLFDDYTERRPGAARELEAYLNRSRPKTRTGSGTPTTPNSSTGSRSFNGSFNSSVGGAPSTQTSWSSLSQRSQGDPGDGTKGAQTASSLSSYAPFAPLSEPPWLLTCANEERSTPKVAHLDMSPYKITSDRDLAKTLREHYSDINRKWWKRLRLRGLTTIEFVQFECHQNRFADVRKCPDMPPHGKDYTFEPGELIPPVGSQYLVHLFKHPEEYDNELITYLRAPKRNGRLGLGVGWGIHLVEGFRADRLWMLVNALFALVSIVFAIAWAAAKNDVQGAFGVAQWICTLAVFAGGWISAYIG